VKKFDKFLKESKGDAEFKSGSFDMANTEGQFTKSKDRKITKQLRDLANNPKDDKKIVNRFFTDKPDSETLKTKSTGDESQFKSNKNVVNRELKKSIPGKTKPITVGALDKRDAAIKRLDKITIEPQKGDATKTQNLIKDLEKKITKPKPGEISRSKELVKDLNPGTNTTIKPSVDKQFSTTQPSSASKNIGKNITTQTTSPKVITKSFSDLGKDIKKATNQVTTGVGEVPKKVSPVKKVLQRTGLTVDKTIKPENIGKSTRQVPKVTGNVVKAATKSSTKKILGKVFTGFGRAATGAVAVSDYLDTVKKEKAKGRGKTSQVVGGLSKAIGGYIGGGIGAGLGGLAGGGVGSFATGTAGAIAGYELGSRAGEKLYNVGRQIVTGQKTFKQLRSDIAGASKDLKDKTVRTTKNLYNTGKKKVSDFIKDK
jgi:hypothetical protein